jgi:hypothetical protein
MKTIKVAILYIFVSLILLSSCSQNSTNTTTPPANQQTGWVVDSTYWIKITYGGHTYSCYGAGNYDNGTYYLQSIPSNQITTITGPDLGINLFGGEMNFRFTNNVYHTEFVPSLHFKKVNTNNWIGSYKGHPYLYATGIANPIYVGTIKDLNASVTYFVDSNATANITSSDVQSFTGTFNFTMHDGNNSIPANGSFRIKKM